VNTAGEAVYGQRAVIEFAPKPASSERLCAGVVSRTNTGDVQYVCAIDQRKAEHAFGAAGFGLWHAADALCESLAMHWSQRGSTEGWVAPFESARIAFVQEFSARDQHAGTAQLLGRISSLATLFDEYTMQAPAQVSNIVARVRRAIVRDVNARHLQKRFQREIHVGHEAGNLRVDFLGQHFACYFLQITTSARGIDATAERAYSRLYELQALRRFVKRPVKSLGLLEDERPTRFELVMVGAENDPVQRRAIARVISLADRGEVIARPLPSAEAAAEHVSTMERRAA
jgi:hypothetical protein